MHKLKQQHGMSPVTILFILVLVGSAIFVSLKLIPVYIEHFSVVSSLKSMEEETGMRRKPTSELMKLLTRRLDINDVKRVTPDDVVISKQPKETTIRVAYEVQIPIIANLDFLLTFDNVATLN